MRARRGGDGALSATHRAGAEAAAELIARSASRHTRRVYASALGQLAGWLDGRRLEDASLAAYLGHLHETGRSAATAALVVAAVRRAARDVGEEPPDGPLTRQALEGFRLAAVADARAHRGQARGLTAEECAAVLATCFRPRRTGRGLERLETAERRGLVDAAIVALLFHGALRRSRLRRSRSVFASNVARQNSGRVVGVVAYGQPACRCQKQPCTRHTARNRRNTRSGVPGSLRSCRRYRSPRAWMARRRASSGRVFLLPIPAIMRERVARSTMSAIVVPARPSEEDGRQQATREIPDVMQLDGTLRRHAEPDWSARPRCGAAAKDGAAVRPDGFRATSP